MIQHKPQHQPKPASEKIAKVKKQMALLTVRAAAKQIGVHENTLRDWEKRGIIKAVRLPTGTRRFPQDEVTACAQAILASLGKGPTDEGSARHHIPTANIGRAPREAGS